MHQKNRANSMLNGFYNYAVIKINREARKDR